tara:strand:+ start:23461 stop:24780 length:1320 start_codon:yes stop_codon:yes gene_type:complete
MMQRITILGGGISGLGAAILAKKKGFNVFLSEKKILSKDSKNLLIKNNIDWEEGKHSINKIINSKEIIVSPGISNSSKIIDKLNSLNIPIISEVEFGFRYSKAKIISITGTNGKTTTTLLIGHILKNSGYDVLVAGNIGISFCMSLVDRDYKYVVLELSSFQLERVEHFRPNIAIILNITPDHLDRYACDFTLYKKTKYRISKNQISSDVLIYNSDNINANEIETSAKKIPISLSKQVKVGGYINNNQIIININNTTMNIQDLALQGKHNLFNSMAAAVAARVLEVKDSVIRQSMIDFQNIEHRLEHVVTIHGIDFINDSKATNINATWFALESMNKKVVWIAGGVDKGNDYEKLNSLVKSKVKSIICLGKNNKNLIDSFSSQVENIVHALNMKDAVRQSYNIANSGDVVLLSPSCASFDLFENFEDRGLQFKQHVRSL